MEINVHMTGEEFMDFMAWKKDKEKYGDLVKHLRAFPVRIAASLQYAVEPTDEKNIKFKIIDHEHLSDVWDMASEFMRIVSA